ncbi:MAG: hypothetical protein ACSHWZ_17355 [Sulfitobacter sp.]
MPRRLTLLTASLAASLLALPALAAGSGDKPTKITCTNGKVFDEETKKCVEPSASGLSDDSRYETLRELAYAGDYTAAQNVLAHMDPLDDRTLTYQGFIHRKQGHRAAAMDFYTKALARNPGNILARSYMGQGLVEDGNVTAAIAQLKAIRSHGGTGTWAESSLRRAIATGQTSSY